MLTSGMYEITSAKEDREWQELLRKTPRLFGLRHLWGIIVRSEWQSSLTAGDTVKTGLKGNLPSGDAWEPVWENLLDLRRSLYPVGDHSRIHTELNPPVAGFCIIF